MAPLLMMQLNQFFKQLTARNLSWSQSGGKMTCKDSDFSESVQLVVTFFRLRHLELP